ncbi:TIGR03619 family F420-dependent LLM class oxidoreductase [Mycolicibacterium palauense]|uniref:TIGR03619 family F420-dependent LLM class oxidoreductase n=1 Tax=Mycolicibacterium palauense TaxID=2034511 RepID=UPI00159B8B39|nr:TIGR03619 family F420-dependent LLM class oxidoreductase [Mycolicibacterium palauense]
MALPFYEHQLGYADIVAFATGAQTAGFDGLWVGDHLVVGPPPQHPRTWYDAPTLLAGLAAVVPNLTLGTDVLIVPYRNPVAAAKMLATVDIISGGRLIVGVGVGVDRVEYEALQVDYHRRGAITDEYLAVWRAVWSDGPVDFTGEYYRLAAERLDPKPVQRPHPPIWVGGNSPAAIRRAATIGDGWQPLSLTPDEYRNSAANLAQLAEQANRPCPTLSYSAMFGAVGARSVDGAERVPLTGGIDQVVDDVGGLRDCGVTNFVFRPGHHGMDNAEVLEQVHLLGSEVVPKARG